MVAALARFATLSAQAFSFFSLFFCARVEGLESCAVELGLREEVQ